MIYSSTVDNWNRVKLMHSFARDLYASTRDSDFRRRHTEGGDFFPFDTEIYETIQNESRTIGMLMVWSVVALESLVNHSIAATVNNRVLATMAIEYPSQITDKLKISGKARSELAKKLVILVAEMEHQSADLVAAIDIANRMADHRNEIVHDKPFELTELGEGEVEIKWFRARGDSESRSFLFADLPKFYVECDAIVQFVTKASVEPPDVEMLFGALIDVFP